MASSIPQPLSRLSFDAAQLMAAHPPKLRHRNKKAVFAIACPAGSTLAGTIVYSRWAAMGLPETCSGMTGLTVESRTDVYDYALSDEAAPKLEWHVNFADPDLFVAYGGGLFAQDEMQVAEHPVLASLLEKLRATGEAAMTVDYGKPTPVLVRGAERRVTVATNPDPVASRPEGLYGNRFGAAPVTAIEQAARRIDPPTITNLIAIAAPSGGSGRYSRDDIDYVMQTAYTGFAAAQLETQSALGVDGNTVLHTGHWGCGAFGGNRVLMAMLQLLSAQLAGIDRVVFHAFDRAGAGAFSEAVERLDRATEMGRATGPTNVDALLERITAMGYRWGESDGN